MKRVMKRLLLNHIIWLLNNENDSTDWQGLLLYVNNLAGKISSAELFSFKLGNVKSDTRTTSGVILVLFLFNYWRIETNLASSLCFYWKGKCVLWCFWSRPNWSQDWDMCFFLFFFGFTGWILNLMLLLLNLIEAVSLLLEIGADCLWKVWSWCVVLAATTNFNETANTEHLLDLFHHSINWYSWLNGGCLWNSKYFCCWQISVWSTVLTSVTF